MAKQNINKKTIKWFEKQGYLIDVCERRHGPRTFDLFGFLDYIALHPDRNVTAGVQATSAGNMASRKRKILEHENYPLVSSKWEICLIGFKPDQDEPHKVEWL